MTCEQYCEDSSNNARGDDDPEQPQEAMLFVTLRKSSKY